MKRLALGLLLAACTPDIPTDPLPAVMEFAPPRVPEPNVAAINRTTGKIDLSLGGIAVPSGDCAAQTVLPQAQCEFYQYLQSLDGYPTSSPARTPVSAAVDLATVPGNVLVLDSAHGKLVDGTAVGYDPTARYLTLAPPRRWDVGGLYWIGVRGYAGGVHATNHQPFVASVPYFLLKSDDPLTCVAAATKPADVPDGCPPLELLVQSMDREAARATVFQLEGLRLALANVWPAMDMLGLPKAETAMLWGFPTHKGPVIDIDPTVGLQPTVVGADEIDLTINGALDPATVSSFALGSPGTVLLLDLTVLAMNPGLAGFPANTSTVNGTTLALKAAAPLVKGHTYGIIISNGVKSPEGKPLVLPPVSAFLMFKGKLFDGQHSTVSTLPDLQAGLLEQGRLQLAGLLASDSIPTLTGLQQKDIAYLYAFVIP
jgi:hypothetical protein